MCACVWGVGGVLPAADGALRFEALFSGNRHPPELHLGLCDATLLKRDSRLR